ncbi:gluconate 2-dehydrogenase gamma chain [Paraburkholderia sp. JPY465]|uniref:gluconate 2-dehydrogenase subunit 3 family protein n=1 Tax=Paraburkholderia sp. JPY465 TaxID=3042285 RepID=UPI003D1EF5A6
MSAVSSSRRRFMQATVAGAVTLPALRSEEVAAASSAGGGEPGARRATVAEVQGYLFLQPAEADFVEALVDHMVPADALSPSGTGVGINTYFDRALGGEWGRGSRLYLAGPWAPGVPSQGYQLPLTPAELFRAGSAALARHLDGQFGKPFSALDADQKEQVLRELESGQLAVESGPPSHEYFRLLYQLVVEGLFADPIYGGNVNKAGWNMIGFPGVIAVHADDVVRFRDRPYVAQPAGIADVS